MWLLKINLECAYRRRSDCSYYTQIFLYIEFSLSKYRMKMAFSIPFEFPGGCSEHFPTSVRLRFAKIQSRSGSITICIYYNAKAGAHCACTYVWKRASSFERPIKRDLFQVRNMNTYRAQSKRWIFQTTSR